MAKPQEPKPREIDPSILTADEIAELQLEAEAEVLAKAKATAKEQLKKKLVLEAERERGQTVRFPVLLEKKEITAEADSDHGRVLGYERQGRDPEKKEPRSPG